jgi:hypothetical protein
MERKLRSDLLISIIKHSTCVRACVCMCVHMCVCSCVRALVTEKWGQSTLCEREQASVFCLQIHMFVTTTVSSFQKHECVQCFALACRHMVGAQFETPNKTTDQRHVLKNEHGGAVKTAVDRGCSECYLWPRTHLGSGGDGCCSHRKDACSCVSQPITYELFP